MNLNLDIFKIVHNDIKPKKGRVLVSEPFQQGYYFSRSVVLLTEHNSEGSMGLVLNKKLEVTASDLIKDFPLEDVMLLCGGPVGTDRLFYLHTFGELIDGSVHIKDNLYFGGDFSKILDLIDEEPSLIDHISFYVGYAGWGPDQLKEEIDDNVWLVADLEEDEIMNSTGEKAWKNVVSMMGRKYKNWTSYPKYPIMN